MAQWYSEYISERTKEGFEFFKNKPGFHANGRPWMGFKRLTHKGKVTGVVPIPEVRRVMRKIVELHNDTSNGWVSFSKIAGFIAAKYPADEYGTWSKNRCQKAYRVETKLVRPAVAAGRFPEC